MFHKNNWPRKKFARLSGHHWKSIHQLWSVSRNLLLPCFLWFFAQKANKIAQKQRHFLSTLPTLFSMPKDNSSVLLARMLARLRILLPMRWNRLRLSAPPEFWRRDHAEEGQTTHNTLCGLSWLFQLWRVFYCWKTHSHTMLRLGAHPEGVSPLTSDRWSSTLFQSGLGVGWT